MCAWIEAISNYKTKVSIVKIIELLNNTIDVKSRTEFFRTVDILNEFVKWDFFFGIIYVVCYDVHYLSEDNQQMLLKAGFWEKIP